MGRHDHHHHCACEHERLAFCKKCNVAYCIDCKQEWQPPCQRWHGYPFTYQGTPYYPYYIGVSADMEMNSVAQWGADHDVAALTSCVHNA